MQKATVTQQWVSANGVTTTLTLQNEKMSELLEQIAQLEPVLFKKGWRVTIQREATTPMVLYCRLR